MKNRIWIFLILIFLILVSFSAGMLTGTGICNDKYYQARVKNLSNRMYFSEACEAIGNARESIYMVMYLVKYHPQDKDSPVAKLLEELVAAHNRGVKVKVVLDYRRMDDMHKGGVSYLAYRFLKEAGIEVNFDSIGSCTHSKLLVIDGKTAILGSTNWTKTAITENNETNVLIHCPPLALEFMEYISGIRLAQEAVRGEGESIDIPYGFISKKDVFGRMWKSEDQRSLDVYLIFLREFTGDFDRPVPVTYREMAEELGLTKRMDRIEWRRQIIKTLRKLANRYNLIELETAFNKPFTAKLKKLDGDCFRFPKGYWTWGWDRRLMMREKMCLLINLAELGRKGEILEWSMSRKQISKRYGIGKRALDKGMGVLRRYGIVEFESSFIKGKDYSSRRPNIYRYKGLYDMEEFEDGLASLEKTYGTDKISLARGYAAVVFRKYDLEAIEDIARYMDIYGKDLVARAFGEVAKKNPDNPLRNLRYAIGTIKKMAEK